MEIKEQLTWIAIFSVLVLWTALIEVDKTDFYLGSASAMTFEQAYPVTVYDKVTNKVLTEEQVMDLLRWHDFKAEIAVDPNAPEVKMYAITEIGERYYPRSPYQIAQLARENPLLGKKYPVVASYQERYVNSGSGSGGGITSGGVS